MKQIIILFMCLSILGCTTTSNYHPNTFNSSELKKRTASIVLEGSFESVHLRVNRSLEEVGYTKVIYSTEDCRYMELAKDISVAKALFTGEAYPHKLNISYAEAGNGKIRLDLVNASTLLFPEKTVQKDIQKIIALLNTYNVILD